MNQLTPIFHPSWGKTSLISYIPSVPTGEFLPAKENVFKVFRMGLQDIRIVILGQDPYPNPGDATGLAFAVPMNKTLTPSLLAIRHEIEKEKVKLSELFYNPQWRDLQYWEEQGIFLLNSSLTVKPNSPGSHKEHWKEFVFETVKLLLKERSNLIWVLWGKQAQDMFKMALMGCQNVSIQSYEPGQIPFYDVHTVLQSAHPAAEFHRGSGGGFYGNNHFKYINYILMSRNQQIVSW
jgi:uracil-DNA glycosylase